MTRITCPVCGHQQVLEPPIVICKNCYADLREFIEQDHLVEGSEATGKVSEEAQIDFLAKIRTNKSAQKRRPGFFCAIHPRQGDIRNFY